MHTRRLGRSDLEISEIGLGSWLTFGTALDRERTEAGIRKAFDLGINFFDTANSYGRGAAESLLGEVLTPYRRADYVLATKVYFPMSETDRGLSAGQIEKQIDGSLKRLRTDYVDLYQCHRYDADTPLEETMRAMSRVVRAGKARHIGFSEWSPEQIEAAERLDGTVRFVSSQPRYSMLYRKPERGVFPVCDRLGIGQIVWSPLAQGVLTGKYQPDRAPPAGSRAASRKIGRFSDSKVLRAVQELRPIARELSLTTAQLALAWILRNGGVGAAIVGASRPDQIAENCGAAGVRLDEASLARIDDVLADVMRR